LKPVETGVARSAPQAQKIVLVPCGCRARRLASLHRDYKFGLFWVNGGACDYRGRPHPLGVRPCRHHSSGKVDTIALERESRRGALDPAFGGAVLTSCGCVAWAPPVSAGHSMSRPFRRAASGRLHCFFAKPRLVYRDERDDSVGHTMVGSACDPRTFRLRIWGSGVRISSGAPLSN
jgi:hypothetical protein